MKKKPDMFSDSVCAVMQTQNVFYHSETENLNKQFPECSGGQSWSLKRYSYKKYTEASCVRLHINCV